jgi:ATP synthase protein I
MNEEEAKKLSTDVMPLGRKVGIQEVRKLNAQKRAVQNIWSGFAMIGLVGWSVAIPTIFGVLLGIWLDKHYPGEHSWTLMLLIVGLVIGCWNAGRWIIEENRTMHTEERKDE